MNLINPQGKREQSSQAMTSLRYSIVWLSALLLQAGRSRIHHSRRTERRLKLWGHGLCCSASRGSRARRFQKQIARLRSSRAFTRDKIVEVSAAESSDFREGMRNNRLSLPACSALRSAERSAVRSPFYYPRELRSDPWRTGPPPWSLVSAQVVEGS